MPTNGNDISTSDAPAGRTPMIQILVWKPDGEFDKFKINTSTRLGKLMRAYTGKYNLPEWSVRFMFEGRQLVPDDTASSLSMEDGEIIDTIHIPFQ